MLNLDQFSEVREGVVEKNEGEERRIGGKV